MRVRIICHRFWPVTGGTENSVLALAKGLSRRGHSVEVVTQAEPGLPPLELLRDRGGAIAVRRIPMRRVGPFRLPLSYWTELARTDGRPTVTHLWGNRIWCFDYHVPYAWVRSEPTVYTGQNFYQYHVNRRWYDRLYFEQYYWRAIRPYSTYVAETQGEADLLKGWGYGGRAVVVEPGIDLDEFDTEPAPSPITGPYVLYAGGYWPNKRVDRIIRGVAASETHPTLVTVGGDAGYPHPQDKAGCRRLAAELGVTLVQLPRVSREELLSLLAGCQVYVQGSEYESFALSLIEAMAFDRPFVAYSGVGGADVLAALGAGRAVHDPAEFGRALDDVLHAPPRVGKRIARERYACEVEADRYLAVYSSVT